MIPFNTTLKKSSLAAIAALIVLLAFAIVYYKVRVFFLDSAYVCTNILIHHGLSIQEHRYGSFITQLVPLIGIKLHLSIKYIVIAYTVSFNVFYLGVILLLVFRFKQYALSILMALYYVLLFSDAYYWTNNEVFQGMAWMFLFLGITVSMGYRKINALLLTIPFLVLGFLAVFTHFLVIMPLIFLWIYLIWDKSNWPFSKRNTILLSNMLLIIIAIKYWFSFNQTYDGEKLHTVANFSVGHIWSSFSAPVITEFLQRCVTNYWIAVIVFTAGIISLFKDGKYLLAAFTLVSVLGYVTIMAITYGDMGSILLFHIESEWTGLGIIMACPFVFSLLPKLKPTPAIVLLAAIFIIRFAYIGMSASKFVQRENLLENVLARMREKNISKLILINNSQLEQQLILSWAVPDETLLLSGSEGDIPQKTFTIRNDEKAVLAGLPDRRSIISCFEIMPPEWFDPAIFQIDTTHVYTVMQYNELFK